MKLKIKNNHKMIPIINCYAPHTQRLNENLDKLVNRYKNGSSIVIVAGNMNAAVEKQMNETCIKTLKRFKKW